MPRLSIVIPCYNCKKTIGRLLNSVLDNKLSKEDYEVIICDDKSTDGFLDVVKTTDNLIRYHNAYDAILGYIYFFKLELFPNICPRMELHDHMATLFSVF